MSLQKYTQITFLLTLVMLGSGNVFGMEPGKGAKRRYTSSRPRSHLQDSANKPFFVPVSSQHEHIHYGGKYYGNDNFSNQERLLREAVLREKSEVLKQKAQHFEVLSKRTEEEAALLEKQRKNFDREQVMHDLQKQILEQQLGDHDEDRQQTQNLLQMKQEDRKEQQELNVIQKQILEQQSSLGYQFKKEALSGCVQGGVQIGATLTLKALDFGIGKVYAQWTGNLTDEQIKAHEAKMSVFLSELQRINAMEQLGLLTQEEAKKERQKFKKASQVIMNDALAMLGTPVEEDKKGIEKELT